MRRILAIGVLATLASAAQAQAQGIVCSGPQRSMMQAELLFGRHIGGRLGVTEKRWAAFLAQEITPRFPDGLTIVDAVGQWRDPARGRIVRERSKLVMILAAADAELTQRLDAIVAAYKRRFRQQSVAVIIRAACVSF